MWVEEEEDWYFSVIDVITAVTDSMRPRKYWNDLKKKLINEEKSQLSENIGQLKMQSPKDGKYYRTDAANTEQVLRLVQSIPSPKAEPFKLWLAEVGRERIDEVFDPELAIERAVSYYRRKGYSEEWISQRLFSIRTRKSLTFEWRERGAKTNAEYAILTNDIYRAWSDMTASEYKGFKGLTKESLRDNMSDMELALSTLAEATTAEIERAVDPDTFDEHRIVAESGGEVASHGRRPRRRSGTRSSRRRPLPTSGGFWSRSSRWRPSQRAMRTDRGLDGFTFSVCCYNERARIDRTSIRAASRNKGMGPAACRAYSSWTTTRTSPPSWRAISKARGSRSSAR